MVGGVCKIGGKLERGVAGYIGRIGSHAVIVAVAAGGAGVQCSIVTSQSYVM